MLTSTIALCCVFLIIFKVDGEPHYVSYIDFPTCDQNVQDADCLSALGVPGYSDHHYNVLNFAFYVAKEDKFYDASQVWAEPSSYFSQSFKDKIADKSDASDEDFRVAVKDLYTSNGIKLLLSVFGATDDPIGASLDAKELADKIADYVKIYKYDGVDIDFESTQYFETNANVNGEEWLITLTTEIHDDLGDDYIITHAPQAPYFMGEPNYERGAYLKVHQDIGSLINWYNIQFYNQGSTTYDDYDSLFIESNGWATNTAIDQLINGDNSMSVSIPESQIVIGKFVREGTDGSVGWISADNLKQYCIDYEWSNGFMLWQFAGDEEHDFDFSNTIIEAFD